MARVGTPPEEVFEAQPAGWAGADHLEHAEHADFFDECKPEGRVGAEAEEQRRAAGLRHCPAQPRPHHLAHFRVHHTAPLPRHSRNSRFAR